MPTCARATAPTRLRSTSPASTRRSCCRTGSCSTRRHPRSRTPRRTARRSRRTATGRRISSASRTSSASRRTSSSTSAGCACSTRMGMRQRARVSWNGQVDGATLPPGTYEIELGARDLAGNSTPVAARWRFRIEIRYIKLATDRIVVRRRQPVRDRCLDRREAVRVEARRARGLRELPGAAPARVAARRAVHADRQRARACVTCGGDRPVIGLAQLGGPIACLGLALLLVAKTRRDRIAGLAFAAFGTGVLGVAVTPRRPLEILGGTFAALAIGLVLARALSSPAVASAVAGACVRARTRRRTRGRCELEAPAPALRRRSRRHDPARLGLLRATRASRELRAACLAARRLRRLDGALARLEQGRERRRGRAARVLRAVRRCSRSRSRGCRGAPRPARALRRARGDGVVFAAVGFYQYDTRDIFQNPKVINANAYAQYFRVNSVFWDPSVYGRFLVARDRAVAGADRPRALAPASPGPPLRRSS